MWQVQRCQRFDSIRFDPIFCFRFDFIIRSNRTFRFEGQIESNRDRTDLGNPGLNRIGGFRFDLPLRSNRWVEIGWNTVHKKYSLGLPQQWPLLCHNTSIDHDPLKGEKGSQSRQMVRDTFAHVQVLSVSLVRVIVFVTIHGPDLSSN